VQPRDVTWEQVNNAKTTLCSIGTFNNKQLYSSWEGTIYKVTSMIQTFLSEISMMHKISRQNFDFEPLLETLYGNKIQKWRSHQAGFTETKSNNFHKFNFWNVTKRDF